MKKFIILIAGCIFALCLNAQNQTMPFILFSNEGQTYGMNNNTNVKASAKIDYRENLPRKFTCIFVNPSSHDTLILVATDEAGFTASTQHTKKGEYVLQPKAVAK